MNHKLTYEIINHIFRRLGVINSNLQDSYFSIKDSYFLASKKICLIDEENNEINNDIWSVDLNLDNNKIKILLSNCSIYNTLEYCLIMSVPDAPVYGIYFNLEDPESCAISYNLNETWMLANEYVQATFLAGMEQIKDLNLTANFQPNIDDLYFKMISFLKFIEERSE